MPLLGIPVIRPQDLLSYRLFINSKLNQQELVAVPCLPTWKSSTEEGEIVQATCEVNALYHDFGVVLLVVKEDEKAALMNLQGVLYSVGTFPLFPPSMFLVHYCRNKQESIFGGQITFLDILALGSKRLCDVPYVERRLVLQTLSVELPTRFSVGAKKGDSTYFLVK